MTLIQSIEQSIATLRTSALARKDPALIRHVLEPLRDAEQRLYVSNVADRDIAEELSEGLARILSNPYRRQQTYLRLREKIDTAEQSSALDAITSCLLETIRFKLKPNDGHLVFMITPLKTTDGSGAID